MKNLVRFWIKALARRFGVFALLRRFDVWWQGFFGLLHDPEYRSLPASINGGLILDVGGNLGQSIISLHRLFPRSSLVSFEPNPACQASLTRVAANIYPPVQLHFIGIGDAEGELSFFVPVLPDGTQMLQEGSFDANVFSEEITLRRIGSDFYLRSVRILVRRIDDFFLNPSLIKIDVQGYELQVLHGAVDTLRRCRPVLFLERDMRNEGQLVDFLQQFKYTKVVIGCNVMFVP